MRRRCFPAVSLALALLVVLSGCAGLATTATTSTTATSTPAPTVPHESQWGIYALDLATSRVSLVYATDHPIAHLDLDRAGTTFAFSMRIDGAADTAEEIVTLPVTGGNVTRLTDNGIMDVYPVWSPDGARLAFLSMHSTLDIYLMNRDGSDQHLLYDSGGHDADIDWVGSEICFTAGSRVWLMNDDGTGARAVTDPPRAGEWGSANLPFGDYDPRLSPDGRTIVFERLVDDTSPHGNYDFFRINADGTGETRLTDNGYSQGLVNWSPDGSRLVFVVAAIDGQGLYHLYTINADGSGYQDITPVYFPPGFLCHCPLFSPDGATVYFIGQWWQ